nr:sensory histidine kinase QseC [uncultured bacterium]
MKFTQRLSLRVRLTLIFLILASVTWLLSSFVAWKQTTDNVDELFDTQLMLFAKRLSTLDLNEINAADRMAQTPNRLKHGHVDDDALTFAIFTHDGRMVLNDGDNGEDIPYSYQREGFADGQLVGEDDPWRFVWMTSPDGKYRIVADELVRRALLARGTTFIQRSRAADLPYPGRNHHCFYAYGGVPA